MKPIIRFIYAFMFLAAVMGAASCSMESETPLNYSIGVYTLERASDSRLYFRADDDTTTFVSTQTLTIPDSLLNTRFYLEFLMSTEKIEGYTYVVEISYLQSVATKTVVNISTQSESDSLGNDMLDLPMIWVSGKYLNVFYSYYTSGNVTHSFSLAQNLYEPTTSPDSIVPLEFRHNDFDDVNPSQYFTNVMSFDLSDLALNRTADFYINIKYHSNTGSYLITSNLKVDVDALNDEQPVYITRPKTRLSLWTHE